MPRPSRSQMCRRLPRRKAYRCRRVSGLVTDGLLTRLGRDAVAPESGTQLIAYSEPVLRGGAGIWVTGRCRPVVLSQRIAEVHQTASAFLPGRKGEQESGPDALTHVNDPHNRVHPSLALRHYDRLETSRSRAYMPDSDCYLPPRQHDK